MRKVTVELETKPELMITKVLRSQGTPLSKPRKYSGPPAHSVGH